MNYIMEGLRNFADIKGRTARRPYWYLVIFAVIISTILGFVLGLLHLGFIASIISVLISIPVITGGVRRMHDIGKSGWYILIPIYGLILALQDSEPAANKWGAVPLQK